MNSKEITNHITAWLSNYCDKAGLSGFVVGISGGVDSALTSTLCALTGKKVVLVSMPIRQTTAEYTRATNHISDLKNRFDNVVAYDIDLTSTFSDFETKMPFDIVSEHLTMANSRARLRMTLLYAIGQANGCLIAGTGNKIEDFGIGFFTKYGDGGVDLSPIADLTKTEVWELSKAIGVIDEIVTAKPTDGLWEDGRSDEDQIGASYPELEWAMNFKGDESSLSERQVEVLAIYRKFNRTNKHKMEPIPVCLIPEKLKI
ncbi:MAG: NAD(+) synthase [Crocinitomicaceae bacterium]|nr:NAD(+) synthase [Crocinitomicaceae bacterium]